MFPSAPHSILTIGAKFKNFLDSDSLRTENMGEIRFLSPPIIYLLRQGTEPSYEMEEKCGFPEKPSETASGRNYIHRSVSIRKPKFWWILYSAVNCSYSRVGNQFPSQQYSAKNERTLSSNEINSFPSLITIIMICKEFCIPQR